MGWDFIDCEEVLERFEGLSDDIQIKTKYCLGIYIPKIGDNPIPEGIKAGSVSREKTQINEKGLLKYRGFPHPIYKNLHFCQMQGDIQIWRKGEWFRPNHFPKDIRAELEELNLKYCPGCNKIHQIGNFSKNKNGFTGVSSQCKKCKSKILQKNYRKNKKTRQENQKQYYLENKEKINERNEKWRKRNPDKVKLYDKNKRINNPDSIKKARAKYLKKKLSTVSGNLNSRLASTLNQSLRRLNLDKSNNRTLDYLGCSLSKLCEIYMQNSNGKVNFGEYRKKYDIDHIVPSSICLEIEKRGLFDKDKLHRLIFATWHYSNLQPLCQKENRHKKKNKIGKTYIYNMSDCEIIKIAEDLIKKTESIRKLDTKKLTPKSEL
jgi:hypothetical protein